jgi:hypothetical protein
MKKNVCGNAFLLEMLILLFFGILGAFLLPWWEGRSLLDGTKESFVLGMVGFLLGLLLGN